MTAKRDLSESVYAAEKEIDKASAAMAPKLAAAVERHAIDTPDGKRITAEARVKIMRDVDKVLDSFYGTRKGGNSTLASLIVRNAQDAMRKPIAAAVTDIEQRLKGEPALLKAMADG